MVIFVYYIIQMLKLSMPQSSVTHVTPNTAIKFLKNICEINLKVLKMRDFDLRRAFFRGFLW